MSHGSTSPTTDRLHIGAGESFVRQLHVDRTHSHVAVTVGERGAARIAVWLEGGVLEHVIDVTLGNEARCTLLTVNGAAHDGILRVIQRADIGGGACMRWQNVTLGSARTEHDLTSTVAGAGGESAVDWMFYAKGTERYALSARNVFDAREGKGEILMRGIAEEKGHVQCKGLIEIGLGGGGTNTYLTQEVLMLDPSSKVDAVPGLEIKTNDVKASHSATVARVTEEDLFYLGARGIHPREARRMFVLGFLGDITGRIVSDEQRDAVIERIERKYQR